MNRQDRALNKRITTAETVLQVLYTKRRDRYIQQLDEEGLSYRQVGEYWGVSGSAIQNSVRAPGTYRWKRMNVHT